jgi:dTDP-4-dehydrorhamnose reductase
MQAQTFYGQTKFYGEEAVRKQAKTAVIIRTSWLYSTYGNNFVKTMRKLGNEKNELGVVADQWGCPTYAADLAQAIVAMLPKIKEGSRETYHFCNSGATNWFGFASEIIRLSGLKCVVKPITTAEYPTKAKRPAYSVLDTTRIKTDFNLTIATWQEALKRCINQF